MYVAVTQELINLPALALFSHLNLYSHFLSYYPVENIISFSCMAHMLRSTDILGHISILSGLKAEY